MKRIFIGLLAVSCFCSCKSVSAKAEVLTPAQMKKIAKNRQVTEHYVSTFEDALVAAFSNNQEWLSNNIDKKIAALELRQAEMNFLPSVTASASTQRNHSHAQQTTDLANGDHLHGRPESSYSTTNQFSVKVEQNIFAGWQTINNMKMKTNEDKATYHKLKDNGAKLIVDVLDAYSEVWKCRQVVAARTKMESNLKNILESQRTKLSAGISTPAEVAAADANYQTAVFNRINSETELFSAESKFERITGVKLAKKVHLPDLHITLPKNLEQFMANSMKFNHSILMSRFQERAALDALNIARGKLAPSIDASLQCGRSASYTPYSDVQGILANARKNQYQNTYTGAIGVTIPLFANSGSDYSNISIADQKAKKAQLEANDTVLKVKEKCVVNWNTYLSSDALIVSSRASVDSAQLSSESNQEESELGMKSNTEVWDQENKLQESKINFADSRKKRLVAAINIMYLMGQLELTDLIKNSGKSVEKNKKNKPAKTEKQSRK